MFPALSHPAYSPIGVKCPTSLGKAFGHEALVGRPRIVATDVDMV